MGFRGAHVYNAVSSAMAERIAGRNEFEGRVVSRVDSDDTSEITLDIGHGKIIEAVKAQKHG